MDFEEVDGKIIFSFPVPPVEFEAVTSIELPEIFADLIHDAMKASEWDTQKRCNYNVLNMYWGLNSESYEEFISYNRNNLEMVVRGESFEFAGDFAKYIDSSVDLVSDADKLLEVIDWISDGGVCPILKSAEQIKADKAAAIVAEKEAKRLELLNGVRYVSDYYSYVVNDVTGATSFHTAIKNIDNTNTFSFGIEVPSPRY